MGTVSIAAIAVVSTVPGATAKVIISLYALKGARPKDRPGIIYALTPLLTSRRGRTNRF